MIYHDAETLEMARAVTGTAQAAIQTALNAFWGNYGKPSEMMLDHLRLLVTQAVRQELKRYFGETVEEDEE